MSQTYLKSILFVLLMFMYQTLIASTQYIPFVMDDIIITIPLTTEEPNNTIDTVAPDKPTLESSPPATTTENQVILTLHGEADSAAYVNAQKVGTLNASGELLLTLDTSGDDGDKVFHIVLKDSANNSSAVLDIVIKKEHDPKFDITYKGLTLYHQDLSPDDYRLEQMTDNAFNILSPSKKLAVANTLLSTLFFGYPQNSLLEKINSSTFISDLREGLNEDRTDKAWLESYILDDTVFRQFDRWAEPQAITILTRFYAMQELDSYFLKNWMAYILTQTIMFSPAYELESTHTPNIGNVYNRIVNFLNEQSGLRYLTYVHMMSEDNWRRFRSPEDNGREMLEIFLFDQNDSHVPLAGQALQNWKLNTDNDTLEVSLNQNRTPLSLFGTTVTNGDDFYREMVKSDTFIVGVTRRLVQFFFPKATPVKMQSLIQSIVSSHPETWQDIMLQIVFSKEYLFHNPRGRSAEENFFSLTKKMDFKHNRSTFYYLKESLEEMHQASMKYKLGKLKRVPLDTLSFAYYHKYIREEILLRRSNLDKVDDYNAWSRHGWGSGLIALDNFTLDENSPATSLESFINALFQTFVYRDANSAEMALFKSHMLYEDEGAYYPHWAFDLLDTYTDTQKQITQRENRRAYIAYIVLDYLSRLDSFYVQKEVN